MIHDFSEVFDTDNELWQKVLAIFKNNEKYPKKRVSNRNLHHKFPRSFSKKLNQSVDNDPDNLISLSLADHFLVHYYYYLLARKGYRQPMAAAFVFMARKSLKYITPETAEKIAKDYEKAEVISQQVWSDERRKEQSEKLSKVKTEYYKDHTIYNKGTSTSRDIVDKQVSGLRKYFEVHPEECLKRSIERKGKSHPHKSGRKGEPLSEFSKLFKAKYGCLPQEYSPSTVIKMEREFYKKFGKLMELQNS